MPNFYFTYSLEGQPFVGGWTLINAPNEEVARSIFRSFHPDRNEGILNCAYVYSEERFQKTKMFKNGNFGKALRERIIVTREVIG